MKYMEKCALFWEWKCSDETGGVGSCGEGYRAEVWRRQKSVDV